MTTLLARVVDRALEAPIAPSFTRVGYDVRRHTEQWRDLSSYDLRGRTILITGATSGLGAAAARQLASMGATLVLLGRDEERTSAAAATLSAEASAPVDHVVCDMGDLAAVRSAASDIRASHPEVDTVIHNAGALAAQRTLAPDGTEQTVASQVLGPFLLTTLLLDLLRTNAPARVLTMSSGGMYAAELTTTDLQMPPHAYDGTRQYALAKRAQVTLTEMWAQRHSDQGVFFHSLHPGWADTPGVRESLPTFRRLTGPLLRDPDQGADTLVWLTADQSALQVNGLFWHDRRPRPTHRMARTRRSDTPARRQQLWDWLEDKTAG